MKKLLTISLLLTALLAPGCTGFFFYPERQFADNPIARSFSPRDVYFKTGDGLTLHGWYFMPQQQALGTVLVLHGNAQNLSTHVNSVLWLVKEGFRVFIFDYRGYGRSEGKASIDGIHRDAEAAFDTALLLANGGRIAVLGQSLGGDIAVYATANYPQKDRIAALVLDSAFAGYRLIAREKLAHFFLTWPFQYPLSYLFNDNYSAATWIGRVSPVPVLILYGAEDPIVPPHHGRMLCEAAKEPRDCRETATPGHVMSFAEENVRRYVAEYLRDRFTGR